MPPVVALFLTLAFIFLLYRRDSREANNVSGALWIPLIWFLITGSQFVSDWLSLLGVPVGAEATFKGVCLVWTVFYIIAVDYPRMMFTDTAENSDTDVEHERGMAMSPDGSVALEGQRQAEEETHV